jgi:glutamyl-tRNA reductase
MRQRLHRPLFLIDIAVPRDLDPNINDLDNVYLYDIDDLMNVVETGKADRDQAAAAAELIVAREATKFGEWLNGLAVVPTIAALKKRSAALCQAELAKTMTQLGNLSDKEKKAVEILAQSIANKMLHHPMLFLKQEANGMDTQSRLSFIRACYDLDETGDDEPERT